MHNIYIFKNDINFYIYIYNKSLLESVFNSNTTTKYNNNNNGYNPYQINGHNTSGSSQYNNLLYNHIFNNNIAQIKGM